MTEPYITIAIDGLSSCGKSTLARDLAEALGYKYIDSGAMYRAVTLYFLEHSVDIYDPQVVAAALKQIDISFEQTSRGPHVLLNGIDVEKQIRTLEVSDLVSPVAAISAVRKRLVELQRQLGKSGGIVMDGRDIGTVVFPDAQLKLYVVAETAERVRRRKADLSRRGIDVSVEDILRNINERDHIDSTREDSPLRQAEDAVLLDNTHMTREEQLEKVIGLVKSRLR